MGKIRKLRREKEAKRKTEKKIIKKAEMQKKSSGRMAKFLMRLNPANIAKEVQVYGYHFSWKTHLLVVLASVLGIGAVGLLFQLETKLLMATIVIMLAALPALILDMYSKMYEQKRFADATTYMEQLLYSFQKTEKVTSALKETMGIFEAGRMRDTIKEAVDYLETGQSHTEKGVLREALEIIENAYECPKIHTVHELLISAEEQGGEMRQSAVLLLNDLELWKRRGYKLQQEKKKSHTNNVLSILVATALCAGALYALAALPGLFGREEPYNIFEVFSVQATSFLLLLFLLFTFSKSMKSLTRNWLKEDGSRSTDSVLDSYYKVVNYEEDREKKKSLIWAAPFFIATVLLFIFYKPWTSMISLALALFMLMQHKTGQSLAKRAVSEELYIVLPEWLMEMALLMQNNNVQVSIAKSIAGAPELLKPELERMTERLQEQPGALESYTAFCRDFDVPEIGSCMKMLHAISEAGTGDAEVQINNLLMRVQEMRNQAEEVRNKNAAFKVKMLFSYPVIGGAVKLFFDLVVGMAYIFEMLGTVGGM